MLKNNLVVFMLDFKGFERKEICNRIYFHSIRKKRLIELVEVDNFGHESITTIDLKDISDIGFMSTYTDIILSKKERQWKKEVEEDEKQYA